MAGYSVSSCLVGDLDELGHEWRELQQSSDCSYFQSWSWIGVWLQCVVGELQPLVVRVWCGDALVGMGIFLQRNIRRRGIVRSNALFLNEYPFDGRDMTIEYNGLLAGRGHERTVYSEVLGHLFQTFRQCDEVFLSAINDDADRALRDAWSGVVARTVRYRQIEESGAWSVDLGTLGEGVDACLSVLSKNRRAQVRRSLRLYETHAPLTLQEAVSLGEVQEYLDGLKTLHSRRWQARGVSGVFANPLWESFHRAVIEAGFPRGEIQLLKVSCGNRVIGYLYNIIWNRRVHVLQTGFELAADRRLMPGYVVHVLAVAHNKAKGMAVYDLLHGDSLYKRIFCNQSRKLHWVVMQRRRLKFMAEDLAVAVVRGCRSLAGGTVRGK